MINAKKIPTPAIIGRHYTNKADAGSNYRITGIITHPPEAEIPPFMEQYRSHPFVTLSCTNGPGLSPVLSATIGHPMPLFIKQFKLINQKKK